MADMKVKDGIMGFVVGDALGVPFEFKERNFFTATGMVGGGTHNQPAGTWSDDSSMTIATMASIAEKGKIDTVDIMTKFVEWMDCGKYTPHGEVFDIGNATQKAICRFIDGIEAEECGGKNERDNGNGALMRILPLAYIDCSDYEIDAVSSLTHAHAISKEGCRICVHFARNLLAGRTPQEALAMIDTALPEYSRLRNVGQLRVEEIRSSGYVVDTLEAVLWCLLNSNSYKDCVLKAVNLGDDTDTIGAIVGGLAGIVYGEAGIPAEWIDQIVGKNYIIEICKEFNDVLTDGIYNIS